MNQKSSCSIWVSRQLLKYQYCISPHVRKQYIVSKSTVAPTTLKLSPTCGSSFTRAKRPQARYTPPSRPLLIREYFILARSAIPADIYCQNRRVNITTRTKRRLYAQLQKFVLVTLLFLAHVAMSAPCSTKGLRRMRNSQRPVRRISRNAQEI